MRVVFGREERASLPIDRALSLLAWERRRMQAQPSIVLGRRNRRLPATVAADA